MYAFITCYYVCVYYVLLCMRLLRMRLWSSVNNVVVLINKSQTRSLFQTSQPIYALRPTLGWSIVVQIALAVPATLSA